MEKKKAKCKGQPYGHVYNLKNVCVNCKETKKIILSKLNSKGDDIEK
jgi:hypothetical protein